MSFLDKICNLFRGYWERDEVRSLQMEATTVGIESLHHRPAGDAELCHLPYIPPCGSPLATCEEHQEPRSKDTPEEPFRSSEELDYFSMILGRDIEM